MPNIIMGVCGFGICIVLICSLIGMLNVSTKSVEKKTEVKL